MVDDGGHPVEPAPPHEDPHLWVDDVVDIHPHCLLERIAAGRVGGLLRLDHLLLGDLLQAVVDARPTVVLDDHPAEGEVVRVLGAEGGPGLSPVEHADERREVAREHRRTGGHGLDEDDAEALAAEVGRDVDVGGAERCGLLLVGDRAHEP